jgi:hypothetical protein
MIKECIFSRFNEPAGHFLGFLGRQKTSCLGILMSRFVESENNLFSIKFLTNFPPLCFLYFFMSFLNKLF